MSSNAESFEPQREIPTSLSGIGRPQAAAVEVRRVSCFVTESLLKRILRKLFPDQRKDERLPVPPLVGYLGLVKASKPYELSDISASGFCMLTEERWTPGTQMPITLQRTTDLGVENPECFTVQATVVRCGSGDVGFSILLSDDDSHAMYGEPIRVRWISKAEMEGFLRRLKGETTAAPAPEDAGQFDKKDKLSGSSLAPVLDLGR